jgi:diamine N-acetyltransferase
MITRTKNNKQLLLRKLEHEDFNKLYIYLQHLGPDTIKRFGPHAFDEPTITMLYQKQDEYLGYIALDEETSEIVAYAIIKLGYLEHDRSRLESYGMGLDTITDCTFAPSVADQWQSIGIGKLLFDFILGDLKPRGIKRIILWGGVQYDNEKAVKFYLRNGFRVLGKFEYNGWNVDMILNVN